MSNVILAIDTSINRCSIAIHKKHNIYFLSETCKNKHTSQVLPMLQKLLFQKNITFQELNYIAFSNGPGNFTSIRIAASIAHSLSISLNIPIIGISTLLTMAEQAWRKYKKKHIIVAIKANKTHVYLGKYIRNQNAIWIKKYTESLMTIEQARDEINNLKTIWIYIGDGWEIINNKNMSNFNKIDIFFPEAQDIIPFVLLKIKNKTKLSSENTKLNYLYDHF